MAAFPEAHTSDGYMPGFGGALRSFQIRAGLDPDGVARPGGPTERALKATLDPARRGRPVTADEVYRGAPPGTAGAAAVPADRPADGGAKAAAKIRKLSQQTAGPGATGAGKNGSGANRRPPVPTVPPPGVRRSVGAGGVNDHGDLLQARRNLARVGYAPRIAGIGEPDGGLAAVQNGLRAYQQAKGLKIDGLMNPGGATERALHRQIAVQQQRLKDRHGEDTAKARRDLSTVSGTVRTADAETLGARYTGAAFDKQRSEAYAEALDRMKRAGAAAGGASGSGSAETGKTAAGPVGGIETAPASAKADAPRRPTLFERSLAAEEQRAGALAAKRMHAGLGDIEHEAERVERRQRRAAAEKAYRTARRPGLDAAGKAIRSIDIAIEHGALPRRFRPLVGHISGTGHRPDPGRYLAVLDRLALLREKRPAVFETLPPRLRTAVAVHRHLEAKMGRLDTTGQTDSERTALRARSSLIRSVANELEGSETFRILGFAADWLPVIGEVKSGVEALIALHNYAEARKRNDREDTARYREEAAWAIVGAIPGLAYTRKGRHLLRRIDVPVTRLSKKAGVTLARRIDESLAGRNRAGEEGKKEAGKGEERLPKNFDRSGNPKPIGKLIARFKVATVDRYGRKSKRENLKLDDLFPTGMAELTKEQRKVANMLVQDAKGRAGEDTVAKWLQDGEFSTAVEKSGRAFRNNAGRLRQYDIATTDKFISVLGLFVFPGTYKATVKNRNTVQIEVKSGGGGRSRRQKDIDEEIKKAAQQGDAKTVAGRNDLMIVDVREFRVPTHMVDKNRFAESLRRPLTKHFGKKKADDFLRDLDEFYRASADASPIPFGVVILYLAGRLHRMGSEE